MNDSLNFPIKIAVSSCLAGEAVRYDGSDLNNAIITNQFSRYCNLQLICPEMAIGLGVPRKPIEIIQDPINDKEFKLVDKVDLNLDYTDSMLSYAKHQLDGFNTLCGYVVKERSPSCGLEMTPRFSSDGDGQIVAQGAGFFTEQIIDNVPWLPIISESGLNDQKQQDNFLERAFVLHLWNAIYKNNYNNNEFENKIEHQIELRGSEIKPLRDFVNENNRQDDNEYITKIMSILKITVTTKMQITFLNKKLQEYEEYGLATEDMATSILKYEHRELSLWEVIQQFRKMFKKRNIVVNSNYFYPDEREIKIRESYFEL